jgi:hypothetical protein
VKGCYPATAQLAAQLLRKGAQGKGNASRLVAVVHVMQNHVLVFLGEIRGAVAVQAGDDAVSVFGSYGGFCSDEEGRGDSMIGR